MILGPWYTSFAQEFQRWHYRMTPKGRERADACTLFSMLQTLNLFALSIWLPSINLPRWAFVSLFVVCFLALQAFNKPVFNQIQVPAKYAQWTDPVPGFKDFPRVYSYLLFTVAMFVVPMFVATGPQA